MQSGRKENTTKYYMLYIYIIAKTKIINSLLEKYSDIIRYNNNIYIYKRYSKICLDKDLMIEETHLV